MVIQQLQQVVGRFPSREDAEAKLNYLKDKGFNVDKIAILAQDDEAAKQLNATPVNQAQEQSKRGGAVAGAITGVGTGFFSGGLLGALSIKFFSEQTPVDNVGTVFFHALVGSLIGIVGCALVGSLMGWVLTREPAKPENLSEDKDNNYLLVVKGSEDSIRQAQAILNQ